MQAVDFTRVTLRDRFWAPRLATNREVTLEVQYKHLQETGRIAGIDPKYKPGDRTAHHPFWDSDVAKWIESAAYCLATHPDPQLEARVDGVIDKFAALQAPDGYMNSWYAAMAPDQRFTNLRDMHELYCAGHLIEAAIAYAQATGKRRFLEMVCRYADYIDSVFGPEEGKKRGYCGHQEIELALVKLYRATGNEKYLRLAQFFIDERGRQPHYFDLEARARGEEPASFPHRTYEYNQSHVPVREQRRVVGHAVRALYMYSAMTDLARETGDRALLEACEALWDDLCRHHLYITGGVGQSRGNEGFTFPYDLPEENAYCETCAAIALVFWNHRLLHLLGDGRFADCMETGLYNGTVSGVSLAGDRFFYENPLASLGRHHRQEWFSCACCPGNLSRLIASVGQYFYSEASDAAWVHLYGAGEAALRLGQTAVRLVQRTDYPWDGAVEIEVDLDAPARFTLALRIPGWCRQATLAVNGEPLPVDRLVERGYAKVRRTWQKGDRVFLELSMPVERVYANPKVRMANGKVALRRGPIVYCLEEVDNPFPPLARIALPRHAPLTAAFEPHLLGGVVVIKGEALVTVDAEDGVLYRSEPPRAELKPIQAVPYCVWDNRAPGQMVVWLRECSGAGAPGESPPRG